MNGCPRVLCRVFCDECGYPASEARYINPADQEGLPHMKVTLNQAGGFITVTLSERNLRILLAKLERGESFRTIHKDGFFVTAELDADHYQDRVPGPMHPLDEQQVQRSSDD